MQITKLSFMSNNTLTDVLSDLDNSKKIIQLKELDFINAQITDETTGDSVKILDSDGQQAVVKIVKEIRPLFRNAVISDSFNDKCFTSEEAEKINLVVLHPIENVHEGYNKKKFANSTLRSLKNNMDALIEAYESDLDGLFNKVFNGLVANIRAIQRTLGVPDNYHLRNHQSVMINGNLNELI